MDGDDDPGESLSPSSVGRQLLLAMLDANNSLGPGYNSFILRQSQQQQQPQQHHERPQKQQHQHHNHFQPSNGSRQNIDFNNSNNNNQYRSFMLSPTLSSNSSFVVDNYDSNGGGAWNGFARPPDNGTSGGGGGGGGSGGGGVSLPMVVVVGQIVGSHVLGSSAMHLLSSEAEPAPSQAMGPQDMAALEQSTWSLLMSALFYGADQFNVNWSNFALALVLVMLMLTTAIGNLFVIVAILIEKNLQTVGNYLVLSLAIADLLVACLVMPLAGIYQILESWTLGILLCDIWTSTDVFCCTAIALDRYWAVTRVDYIRCQRNKRRILFMIFFVWMAACIISLGPLFGWKDAEFESRITIYKECLISQDVGYQIFATCTTFYFPLILTLIFYWKIYQVARKRIRRKLGKRTQVVLQHPSSSSSVTGSPGPRLLNQHHQLGLGARQPTRPRPDQERAASECLPANGTRAPPAAEPTVCGCTCHRQTGGPAASRPPDAHWPAAERLAGKPADALSRRLSGGALISGQPASAHSSWRRLESSDPKEGARRLGATEGDTTTVPGEPEPPSDAPDRGPAHRTEPANEDDLGQSGFATCSISTTTSGTSSQSSGAGATCPASECRNSPRTKHRLARRQAGDSEAPADGGRLAGANMRPLGGSIRLERLPDCGKCRRTNWLASRDQHWPRLIRCQQHNVNDGVIASDNHNGLDERLDEPDQGAPDSGGCAKRGPASQYRRWRTTDSAEGRHLSRDANSASVSEARSASGEDRDRDRGPDADHDHDEEAASSAANSSSRCASSSLINCGSQRAIITDSGQQAIRDQRASLCDEPNCCAACSCCEAAEAQPPPPPARPPAPPASTIDQLGLDQTASSCRKDSLGVRGALLRAQSGPDWLLESNELAESEPVEPPKLGHIDLALADQAAGEPVGPPAASRSPAANHDQAQLMPQCGGLCARLLRLARLAGSWQRPNRGRWSLATGPRSSLAGGSSLLSQPGCCSSAILSGCHEQLANCQVLVVDQRGRSSLVSLAGRCELRAAPSTEHGPRAVFCPDCRCPSGLIGGGANYLNNLRSSQPSSPGPLQSGKLNRGRPTCGSGSGLPSQSATGVPEASAPRPMVSIDLRGRSGLVAGTVSQNQSMSMEGVESKRERKAAKTLSIITGVFVMCWLPFFINAITMALLELKPHKYLFAVLLWLGYANSMLNPIIYTIFSPDFRKAFKHLLCGKDKNGTASGCSGTAGANSNNCHTYRPPLSQPGLEQPHHHHHHQQQQQPDQLSQILVAALCRCCCWCSLHKWSSHNSATEARRTSSRRPQPSASYISATNYNNTAKLLVESPRKSLNSKRDPNMHSGITNDF